MTSLAVPELTEGGYITDDMAVNGSSYDSLSLPFTTADLIQSTVSQVLEGNWDNLSLPLNDWQKSQLPNVRESGIRCLLDMWFIKQHELPEGKYCNATWDNVYCWPPTPIDNIVSRTCTEILQESEPTLATHIRGNAFRQCSEDATWLWGNWTNYTACADSYEEYVWNKEEEQKLVVSVQHVLFVGSGLSMICLALALAIFYYFKCLRCDRVTVHVHLMLALMLRSALLVVITEPFIFNRTRHYRHVDLICKAVLATNLYATFVSINWMFIQGIYLHGKLTTNVFDKETPFKIYYVVGWVIPLFLVMVYAAVVELLHPVHCWKGYSERSEIWILLGPMIFALVANLLFLINIMRILLTKVQRPNNTSDAVQIRRAVKATLVLFPLLGITNLLFLLNPGGLYHKYFVVFNALCGSTQGMLVSILYCFISKDVRAAILRLYRRIKTRRNANNSIQSSQSSFVLRLSTIRRQPRIYFRNSPPQASEEASMSPGSCNASPELVMVPEGLNEDITSFSMPSFSDGYGNGVSSCNPALPQRKVENVEGFLVDIPLGKLKG